MRKLLGLIAVALLIFVTGCDFRSDAEVLEDAKEKIEIDYAEGDSIDSVTGDLTLPGGIEDSKQDINVYWESDNEAVVSDSGYIIRPSYTEGDQEVTLTARLEFGDESITKEFTVTVIKEESTTQELLDEAVDNLEITFSSGDQLDSVTGNLTLPSTEGDATITWESSNTTVITNEGVITRSSFLDSNETVEMTATLTIESETKTKEFTLTVLKRDSILDTEAVIEAKEEFASTIDRSEIVDEDFELPTNGLYDTTITWTSSNSDVLEITSEQTESGILVKVNQPAYGLEDEIVKLTASFTKGDATETFTFKVIVLKEPNTTPTLLGVKTFQLYYTGSGDYDPIKNITAYDAEDGDLTDITVEYPSNFDLTETGSYVLKIKVEDSEGATDKATVVLEVREGAIPNQLTTDPVEITFWHAFGPTKESLLRTYADEFQQLYPNVSIVLQSQGGYDDLLSRTVSSIIAGTQPTMVIGYPDDLENYLIADAIESLDEYVVHPEFGVNLDDFMSPFINKNQTSYDSTSRLYQLPFGKSTDVLYYNKTYFEQHSLDVPTTWDEVEQVATYIKANNTSDDVYGLAFDSSSKMYSTLAEQWGGSAFEVDVNGHVALSSENVEMLTYIKGLGDQNYVTLPQAWGQNYSNIPFAREKVFMVVGSNLAANYFANSPFDIGVAPVPGKDENNRQVATTGSNLAIMRSATDQEQLAAWLFTKYLTSQEVTTDWSSETGYLPVRASAFESDAYQSYLTENPTDPELMAANAAYDQIDDLFFQLTFMDSTITNDKLALILEEILVNGKEIQQAIDDTLNSN